MASPRLLLDAPAFPLSYSLSLHDALPISATAANVSVGGTATALNNLQNVSPARSEEHTSELQSLRQLVCRLLLEKKNMVWVLGLKSYPESTESWRDRIIVG